MNLVDALVMVSEGTAKASQPCDLEVGTVTTVNPLSITRDIAQAPLQEQVLILTENVVEKKIPILNHVHHIDTLGHSHTSPDGTTSTNLTGSYPTLTSLVSSGADGDQNQNIVCYEHGQPLPIEDGYIILNRALEIGDKVLLLKVQKGQKFVILSRIFDFTN
nr:MAG TPA: Protein of unknown function (DUF2577) [Caudoviricetes sp.]